MDNKKISCLIDNTKVIFENYNKLIKYYSRYDKTNIKSVIISVDTKELSLLQSLYYLSTNIIPN